MLIKANKLRVQSAQFDACLVGRKLPIDLGGADISVAFPGGDLTDLLPRADEDGRDQARRGCLDATG